MKVKVVVLYICTTLSSIAYMSACLLVQVPGGRGSRHGPGVRVPLRVGGPGNTAVILSSDWSPGHNTLLSLASDSHRVHALDLRGAAPGQALVLNQVSGHTMLKWAAWTLGHF